MARLLTTEASEAEAELAALIGAELRQPVPPAIPALAQALAARARGGAAAVLYYGSGLRDAALDGVLDFYVLLESAGDWPGGTLAALANRLLPPNVGYAEEGAGGLTLRAKYAVMTLAQFHRAMAERSADTTLWARFSQPSACVHLRSEADCARVVAALSRATTTAARWAALLGPTAGRAIDYWAALFAHTYALELRVERGARGEAVLARAPERYARVLPAAWRAAGIAFEAGADGLLRPQCSAAERSAAARQWALRRRLGRPLNLLRLVKAAFTFERAMDYVAWKVERHSGIRLELAPWQRRHPLLAAPGVYLRLRRQGLLR